MTRTARFATLCAVAALWPAAASAGEHRLGFGYHYWETLDDVDLGALDEIDDEGSSIVVSYQYLPGGLLRFELDLEYFADGFGGATEEAYSPQGYVLAGRGVYGGVGIGITRSDALPGGDDWSDPWYAARVGFDFLLLPRLHLDVNANYRADAFEDLDRAESDTVTLGASVRFSF
jgi:opacity protein-like surface antigen